MASLSRVVAKTRADHLGRFWMHGTPWRHTRVSLVGCCWCWCYSFWRGVFHLFISLFSSSHILRDMSPHSSSVVGFHSHFQRRGKNWLNSAVRQRSLDLLFLLHLFTIREVPALRREWWFIAVLTSGWKQQGTCLTTALSMREANGCTLFGGGNGTLLNACNKSCKKTNKKKPKTKQTNI